jgi:hypothetical protein
VITPILTFLSTRLVYVFVATVVVIVSVPAVVVAIHGNTITITTAASASRHHDDDRAQIIVKVKDAGDSVIVELNDAEAACDAQITALATKSKLSAGATAAALEKGKDDFHAAISPFVTEIQDDEDEIAHRTVVTVAVEQEFLVRIRSIEVAVLGQNGQNATVVTVCEEIIVQVTQVIVTVVAQPPSSDESDDARFSALLR